MSVKFTVQIPEELDDRMTAHRERKGVSKTHFAREAIAKALDEAGVPPVVKPSRKPRPAKSA